MNSNTLLDIAGIYQNISESYQDISERIDPNETPEQRRRRTGRPQTAAQRRKQLADRAAREGIQDIIATQKALEKAQRDRANRAPAPAPAPQAPASVVRRLPSQAERGNTSGRRDTAALRAASIIRQIRTQREEIECDGEYYVFESKKKKKKKTSRKPKYWWDDDGDGIGYEKNEVTGHFKRGPRVAREEYSDWRSDLVEISDLIEAQKKTIN